MELTTQEVKDWIILFSDFSWPLVAIFIVIFYRDSVQYFIKAVIDLIFRRK